MGSFREEFARTERSLIRNPASIKERFVAAAINLTALRSNKWELDKLPEELRNEVLSFLDKITSGGPGGNGAVYNTIMPMSVDEVQMLVDEFLALHYEIENFPR